MHWVLSHVPNLISLFTYAFFIWFAIFILTNSPRQRSSILASLAMVITAIYIFSMIVSSTMVTKESYILWLKALWWASALPAVVWLHTTLVLLSDVKNGYASGNLEYEKSKSVFAYIRHFINELFREITPLQKWGLCFLYLAGLFFGIGGTQGNWLFLYSQTKKSAFPWSVYFVQSGPYYLAFTIFVVFSLAWSIQNLTQAYYVSETDQSRVKFKSLRRGTYLFLFAAAVITLLNQQTWPLPEATGHVILAIGIIQAGFAIIRDNSKIEGRQFFANFWSLFLALFPLLLLFVLVFMKTQPNPSIESLSYLVTLVVFGALASGSIRRLLESRFLDSRVNPTKVILNQLIKKLLEISPQMVDFWKKQEDQLSPMEMQIFEVYGSGLGRRSAQDIADILPSHSKGKATIINKDLENIRTCFQCKKSAELIVIWLLLSDKKIDNSLHNLEPTDIYSS